MNRVDNPRGYAYVAFVSSYRNMQNWNWFSARRRSGMGPTQGQWIDHGLEIYDRMTTPTLEADVEAHHKMISEIITLHSGSLRAEMRGRFTQRRTSEGGRAFVDTHIPSIDAPLNGGDDWDSNETRASRIEEPFNMFEAFDEASDLDRRLSELLPLLTASQLKIVLAMVYDPGLTPTEIGEQLGVSRQYVNRVLEVVRRKAQETTGDNDVE